MEARANYLLIGGFAVAFVLGLFGFVIWLEQWGFGEEQQRYVVVFRDEVTPAGLDQGAQVLFNGVAVGSVQSIRLNRRDSQQALATISVNADTPIRTDSVASEENKGYTGRTYLAISDGSPDAPLLEPEGDELPVIPAQPGGISAVVKKAPEIADRILEVADQASALLGGGAGEGEDVGAILANLRRVTDVIASRDEAIGRIIDNLAEASESVKVAARGAEGVVRAGAATAEEAQATVAEVRGLVQDDLAPLLQEGATAATEAAEAAESVNQLVSGAREPVEQFTEQGFTEFRHFINEARLLVQDLRQVSERLRDNPASVLFGDGQAGFEPE